MILRPAFAAALLLAGGLACAATLKATLLVPADDVRLERSRAERGYLGHPGGPAKDGVAMALDESQFELDAAQAAAIYIRHYYEVPKISLLPEPLRALIEQAAAEVEGTR